MSFAVVSGSSTGVLLRDYDAPRADVTWGTEGPEAAPVHAASHIARSLDEAPANGLRSHELDPPEVTAQETQARGGAVHSSATRRAASVD